MSTEQSDFWARPGNPHPEPGLPSERAVTERLADAVADGQLTRRQCCDCGQTYDGAPLDHVCPQCPVDPGCDNHLPHVHHTPGCRFVPRGRDSGWLCERCDMVFPEFSQCQEHMDVMLHRPQIPEWLEATGQSETITAEAQRLVLGDRQDDYGHPADDFAKTGRMWGAVLEDWVRAGGGDVPPELVALMMVCVKISREVNRPKRDNRVDGIGYFLTNELIHERAAGA